ncbi:MAG: small multi-drug export protein, partial [Candidatus Diapherotrites archaeon]
MAALLDDILYVFLITLLPYIELRGAIPVGILALKMDPLLVFALATAANILIIFPIFFFLELFFPFLEKRFKFLESFIEGARNKAEKAVDKYGFLGLMVFVAIPLPGTGAYSGALGAYLLGIKKRKAIPAIALG